MSDRVPDAAVLAWARGQVEEVAAKYDGFAARESNPILATAMQFAARVMRLEFCGGDDGAVDGRVAGRFEGRWTGEKIDG